MGQTVVVDNKTGAGGTIGAAQVAKSAPDGYTLLANSSAHTVNPSIYPNLAYDTAKDLMGVSLLAQLPNIMVASPTRGWKTVDGCRQRGQGAARQDQLRLGRRRLRHAHERREVQALGRHRRRAHPLSRHAGSAGRHHERPDRLLLLAGDCRAGDGARRPVVALAAGSARRSSVLPDVPTTEEAGFKGSAYDFWCALFAPAGTPPAVIARLNTEVRKALDSPEVKERLDALGTDIAPTTPDELDRIVVRELKENAVLVKEAGIKVQ